MTPADAEMTSRRFGWPTSRPSGAISAEEARRQPEARRPAAADPGRDRDRVAQGVTRAGEDVRLADDAAVQRGDDPGGEVVDVDEAEADVVERPIRQPAGVGQASCSPKLEWSPGP